LYVYNESGTTATIAVNLLDRDGNNLATHNVPGSNPVVQYPGEAGNSTVTLADRHTRNLNWVMPQTGGGPNPPIDGVTDVVFTVRVQSDQPIVVGANFQFNGNLPSQCSLLPK
jgi:hypothetical protein